MFRSKSEVDKHVGRLLSRLYTTTEVRARKVFPNLYRFTIVQFNFLEKQREFQNSKTLFRHQRV